MHVAKVKVNVLWLIPHVMLILLVNSQMIVAKTKGKKQKTEN